MFRVAPLQRQLLAVAQVLETGDTALVLAGTPVSARNAPVIERKATYVFRKDTGDRWLCAIVIAHTLPRRR
jgi:ketosteroid isomerase-like protein